jgi:hypothetical protein
MAKRVCGVSEGVGREAYIGRLTGELNIFVLNTNTTTTPRVRGSSYLSGKGDE